MSVRRIPPGAGAARPTRGGTAARDVLEAHARRTVDYALARRSTLTGLASGRVSRSEACDAQAYLLRAARFHGEASIEDCPVCKRGPLSNVCYTWGDSFRADANGRARPARELAEMASSHPDFTVFLVEVCADCRWNHLLASYVLGTGQATRKRARS